MPTYVYECYSCERQVEIVCKIDERPLTIRCSDCKGLLRQILTPVVIECDSIADVKWLPEAARTVSMEHKLGIKPIEGRQQFKEFIKEKGLRPADSGVNLSEV